METATERRRKKGDNLYKTNINKKRQTQVAGERDKQRKREETETAE